MPKPKTEIELKIESLEARIKNLETHAGVSNPDYDPEMVAADKDKNPEFENMNEEEMPF